MNSKILIYTRDWFEGYYSKLQAEIEKNSDFEVVRISDYSVKGAIDFRKKAVKLRDDLNNQKTSIDHNKCFNDIISRDRLLRTLDKNEALLRVKSYYKCFSDYLSKNNIKLIVSATVDQYFIDIVYLLCIENKIKFIGYHISVLPNYLLITARGESNIISKTNSSEINKNIKTLSSNSFKPSYIPQKINYSKIFLNRYIKNLFRYIYFSLKKIQKKSLMHYHIEANVSETKRMTTINVLKGLFFKYDLFDCNNEFLYIPLQFDPECNGEYWPKITKYETYNNQILNFVKANNTKIIVVREHPNMIGLRESDFYYKLQKLGASIIHPKESHRDIIKKCKAIVTLNSSVGIEGLFFNKPIICLSKPYYSSDCHIIIDNNSKVSYKEIELVAKRDFKKSLNDSITIVLKSSLGFSIPDIRYNENSNDNHYLEDFSKFIINSALNESEDLIQSDSSKVYSII